MVLGFHNIYWTILDWKIVLAPSLPTPHFTNLYEYAWDFNFLKSMRLSYPMGYQVVFVVPNMMTLQLVLLFVIHVAITAVVAITVVTAAILVATAAIAAADETKFAGIHL